MSVMTVGPEQDEDSLEPLFQFQTFFFWIWNNLGVFPLKLPERTIFPNPPKRVPSRGAFHFPWNSWGREQYYKTKIKSITTIWSTIVRKVEIVQRKWQNKHSPSSIKNEDTDLKDLQIITCYNKIGGQWWLFESINETWDLNVPKTSKGVFYCKCGFSVSLTLIGDI